MAINIKKIFPLDNKPGTGIGIALPFNAPNVFFSTYLTKDAIKNNLINFFLTNKNERYLNGEFGANLRSFIFEQINSKNLEYIKENIQSLLKQYFTNIKINNLEINQSPDNNIINIILKYEIINTGITDTINITFN